MRYSLDSASGETLQGLLSFENHRYYTTKIREYIEAYLPTPGKNWDNDEFRKRSYEISGLEQLEQLLLLNPELGFYEIVDEFSGELKIAYESLDTPSGVFEVVSCILETLNEFIFWLDNFA